MGQGDKEQNFAYIKAPNYLLCRSLASLMFVWFHRSRQQSNQSLQVIHLCRFVFHATRLSSFPYNSTRYTDTSRQHRRQNNILDHLMATL